MKKIQQNFNKVNFHNKMNIKLSRFILAYKFCTWETMVCFNAKNFLTCTCQA